MLLHSIDDIEALFKQVEVLTNQVSLLENKIEALKRENEALNFLKRENELLKKRLSKYETPKTATIVRFLRPRMRTGPLRARV